MKCNTLKNIKSSLPELSGSSGGERFGMQHLTKTQVSRNVVVGVVVVGLENT